MPHTKIRWAGSWYQIRRKSQYAPTHAWYNYKTKRIATGTPRPQRVIKTFKIIRRVRTVRPTSIARYRKFNRKD